jgi:hypothetical protein
MRGRRADGRYPAARPERSLAGVAAAAGATLLGVASHVVHHLGPVLGGAVLAGTVGTLLVGAVGMLLSVPLLRRLHRRFGTWRAPAIALGALAAMFVTSSLLVGPLFAGH